MTEIGPIGPNRIESKVRATKQRQDTSSQFSAAELLALIQNMRQSLEGLIPPPPPPPPSGGPSSDPRSAELLLQQREMAVKASGNRNQVGGANANLPAGGAGMSSLDGLRALLGLNNETRAPEAPRDTTNLSDKANEILQRRARRQEASAGVIEKPITNPTEPGEEQPLVESFLGQTTDRQAAPRRRRIQNPTLLTA
ncbi:MAG: hypothetical protein AB7S38_32810 [Vulcanimicrobiota bacterium]